MSNPVNGAYNAKHQEENSFLKYFRSRKGQRLIITILFMILPLFLLILFTYYPFLKMVKFSFYKIKTYAGNHLFHYV